MDQHLFLEPHHCTYGEEEPAALHSWMAGLYLRRERPLLMLLNESGPGRPACWGRAGGSQSLRREPPPGGGDGGSQAPGSGQVFAAQPAKEVLIQLCRERPKPSRASVPVTQLSG